MKHLDLFSGIGGFAYAVDSVWPGSTHVFCDNNVFCQKVLKKHWPGAKIYDHIRQLEQEDSFDLVTGGFPCQPFSSAGKKKAKNDDRYLWPEMLRVIRISKPTWVIGENVAGIIKLAADQVISDMEAEGYTTQTFIIPACAVGAPHRRDRVWFIGYSPSNRLNATKDSQSSIKRDDDNEEGENKVCQSKRTDTLWFDTTSWNENWIDVATRLCRVDDGVSNRVDRLRGLGNAIVPQVVIEIMKAIKDSNL